MGTLHRFEPGGYAFLEGGFPYSAGVAALPGHTIVRARFRRVMPVAQAFGAIESHLRAIGRPLTSLCAAELRSPRPFSFEGFRDFNRGYVAVLERWGLYRDALNPVARSNVCPRDDAPPEPGFHAFSYTVPSACPTRAFVVAGSGEWPEDQPFPEGIVARDDLSAQGLAAKATYVLKTMRERTEGLGAQWSELTAAQVYTVHDIHPLLRSHFTAQDLTRLGLTWHVCAPPIIGLEFEMDVRGLSSELVLD
ncbi:MAG: hypothetical protein RIS35_464 [Pseudomonadota bacterium]